MARANDNEVQQLQHTQTEMWDIMKELHKEGVWSLYTGAEIPPVPPAILSEEDIENLLQWAKRFAKIGQVIRQVVGKGKKEQV